MPAEPSPRRPRSWPERQRLWRAREDRFTRWTHQAAAQRWVLLALGLVSRVSDGWVWAALAVLLPLATGETGTRCVVRMLAVGALNVVLYKIIKHSVARPRPYRGCSGVTACARSLDEYSFPSGHTMHAVAYGLIVGVYYPQCRWLTGGFALLVAASRVVLGLHYPSDVVAGAAIGALTALVSFDLL
jgi:undecaprenyl-diphosphatase